MSLKMNLQVALGCKSITANVTFVWSFTSVGTDMNLQGTVISKYFAAKFALVFEEGLLRTGLCFKTPQRLGACLSDFAQLKQQIVRSVGCGWPLYLGSVAARDLEILQPSW